MAGHDLRQAPVLESLETRLLLSAQSLLLPALLGDQANASDSTLITGEDFDRLQPFGGLMYASSANSGSLGSSGDTSSFDFFVEAGQSISAVVVPDSSAVTLDITLVGESNTFTAPAAGDAAVLPATAIGSDNTYTVRVSGNGATAFTLNVYRNAAVEAQVGDSGDGNALAIDSSFMMIGSGRYGVLGTSQAPLADVDQYTIDLTGKAGASLDVILSGQDWIDFSSETLQLLDTDGSTVLATASSSPLGATANNYDLGILDFVVPGDGVYTLRLNSQVGGDYGIVVTDELTYESETNDTTSDTLRALDNTGAALGTLGSIATPGVNLIQDPGFELGTPNSAWNEFSTNFGTPICSTAMCGYGGGTGPHSGTYWNWMGGIEYYTELGYVDQDIVFPNGTTTLTFFLEINTTIDPILWGTGLDYMDVLIDGVQVFEVIEEDASTYNTYQQVVLDVSDFGDGKTHNLKFDSQTLGLLGVTNFFVDDVELYAGPFQGGSGASVVVDIPHGFSEVTKNHHHDDATSWWHDHQADGLEYATDRLIVHYADLAQGDTMNAIRDIGYKELYYFSSINASLIEVSDPGENLLAAAQAMSNDPAVLYVEPDYRLHTMATIPDDSLFTDLWGMHNTGQSGGTADADIDAPEAWDLFTGSTSVVIAGIDTGVDYTHPDLVDNMWINPGEVPGDGIDNDSNGYIDDIYGIDTSSHDSDPFDDNGHGTHTAGTFAAVGNNTVGVAGANWDVQVMALKFLDASGSGNTSDAIELIEYMTMMKTTYGVNVVVSNNSWGGGGFSQSLKDAIEQSNNAGIMFAAAAGNGGFDGFGDDNDITPQYPSNYDLPGIIAVASTDRNDNRSGFSNFGLTSVDLAAPGSSIMSTVPVAGDPFIADPSGYRAISGTSMATPHVAGAVAMLMAADPSLTLAQVKAAIMDNVDLIPAMSRISASGGRLNLYNALASLGSLGPKVARVSPGAAPINDLNVTTLQLKFTEPITTASATDTANYQLIEAGGNGVFEAGGGDDVTIGLASAPQFNGSTVVDLTIDAAFSPLAVGKYQLTIDGDSSIVDLEGNPLNSVANPTGGSDHIHGFEIVFFAEAGGDMYTIDLTQGQTISVTTQTPFTHASSMPLNDLDPKLVIIAPSGGAVALDDNSLDGKNAQIEDFVASQAGTYIIQVLSAAGSGEYVLNVDTGPSNEVIVDNQDSTGFSTTGDWFESSAVDEYNGSSLWADTLGATATWTPALSSAGTYEVYAWWSAVSSSGRFNRDDTAQFTILHNGDATVVNVDQDINSGQWALLDTFNFVADGSEKITLTRNNNNQGATAADAVRFVQVSPTTEIIVDNQDATGFSTTGDWSESIAVDEYSDSSLWTDTLGATATWTPTLATAGTYEVYAWWSAASSDGTFDRDDTAMYTINHNGVSTTMSVDQDVNSGQWELLTKIEFAASGVENVVLTRGDNDSGTTVADAVRLVLVSPIEIIVDNQDVTRFSATGDWSESSAVDEYNNSSLWTDTLGATATWTPLLTEPGTYKVYAWWSAATADGTFDRDDTAMYTINHNGASTTVSVDQDVNSGQWVFLDTVEFAANGVENVALTRGDDHDPGTTIADAVRLVKDNVSTRVIVDNQDATGFSTTEDWTESIAVDEYEGSSLWSVSTNASAIWTPVLPGAGTYQVYAWWSAESSDGTFDRDDTALYLINHNGAITTVPVDQNFNSGQWVLLDTVVFNGSGTENVALRRYGNRTRGATVADAVQFVHISDSLSSAMATVAPPSKITATRTQRQLQAAYWQWQQHVDTDDGPLDVLNSPLSFAINPTSIEKPNSRSQNDPNIPRMRPAMASPRGSPS